MSTFVYGDECSNITSIEFTEEEVEMCDIGVEDTHAYYANGIYLSNSGQELRIPANLSRDPLMVKTFMDGGDLHKETAYKVFGKENYNKDYRKLAKVITLGILYGMSHYTFAKKNHRTPEEAEAFFKQHKHSFATLFAWTQREIKRAKRNGTVYTHFGRPRRLLGYLSSPDRKVQAFGERSVVNTQIQGLAADIIKLVLIRLYRNVFHHPDYEHDAEFKACIHDEVDFSVSQSRIQEMLTLLEKNMRVLIPNWPVIMEVEVSVGTSWGWLFPFRRDSKGIWEPAYEKIGDES